MEFNSPAFIEWIVLNFVLIVVSVILGLKYYKEKRRMSSHCLITEHAQFASFN